MAEHDADSETAVAAGQTALASRRAEDAEIEGATILLVDDHEQNLELLHAYLEDLRCRILAARDGVDECSRSAGREALRGGDQTGRIFGTADARAVHVQGG